MTELRRAHRLYSLVAAFYDLRVRYFLRWRKAALQALHPRPGDTVLDLACGTGLNFPYILDRTGREGRVIGVDITHAMLRQARKKVRSHRWDSVSLVRGDAASLSLANESCDGVLCSYGMAIIPEYLKAMAEAVRVLRPGGRLVLLEPKHGTALWARAVTALTPLAGFGVVRLDRRPWEELPGLLTDVSRREYAGGIVCISTGTKAKEP